MRKNIFLQLPNLLRQRTYIHCYFPGVLCQYPFRIFCQNFQSNKYRRQIDFLRFISFNFSSSIRLNVGEGILDFLYADFETPYKESYLFSYMTEVLLPEVAKDYSEELQELLDKIKSEQKSPSNVNKVLSEADLIYEDYLRYCSTASYVKSISYASLYSAICPPVSSEHYVYTVSWIHFILNTVNCNYTFSSILIQPISRLYKK